jgi:hypothetical protein
MYMTTAGDTTFKGDVAGDAFYDKGGTTVGNYCRGRFLQTFSLPYAVLDSGGSLATYSPLFSAPIGVTDAAQGSNFITAKYASVAPHDGRIQKVRIAARNGSPTATCNLSMYVFTGATLPDETSITDTSLNGTNSAYFTSGAAIPDNTISPYNTIVTKGYNDFTDKARLDFSQGDYLAFLIRADSGNAETTVTITCEFYMDDTP